MEETQFLRLLFYVLIGGAGLILTIVVAALSANKAVRRLIDEKLASHHKHQHVLQGDTTIRDRLVECRRQCPVINPQPPSGGTPPGGGGRDAGRYSSVPSGGKR